MRCLILINSAAGGVAACGADALADALTEAAAEAGWSSDVVKAGPDELAAAMRAFNKADAVACAGGDGTIAALAPAAIDKGVPIIPLPCGTMNLFARDLGLPPGPREALRAALECGAPSRADLGIVETAEHGRSAFLNNIVFGPYAELAEAREKLRDAASVADTGAAIVEAAAALINAAPKPHVVTLDHERIVMQTNTIVVANNCYTECIDLAPRRACLDSGRLALYLVRADGAVSFAARLVEFLNGTLDNSAMIDLRVGRRCTVERPDEPLAYAVDGERRQTQGPVAMRLSPRALRVLAPAERRAALREARSLESAAP
jgi:diacylglycerol kinase family enzyme